MGRFLTSSITVNRPAMFSFRKQTSHFLACGLLTFFIHALAGTAALAQSWSWNIEDVDKNGMSTSLAADSDGNIHIVYGGESNNLMYGFRPVGRSSKWFTMSLGGPVSFAKLTLDKQGNAHVCSTFNRLRYGYFDGKQWSRIAEIAADAATIVYSCSVAIGPDGSPHLAWYKEKNEDGGYFLHIKYAELEDKVWVERTIDFGPQDGKWNAMVLDSKGAPYVSYDEFVTGAMKVAHKAGDKWNVEVVESRKSGGDYNIGMGNSLAIDAQDNLYVAYYTSGSIHFARREMDHWVVETVAPVNSTGGWLNYRSALVLDKAGFPHIAYEDGGTVRHAYWTGKRWQIQTIVRSGPDRNRFPSMTIDANDRIYVSFRDPIDGSLKVAVGNPVASQDASAEHPSSK
jgi:hypothetical protein